MMLIALRAPVFATNTLVLAPEPGGPAVVVDPGAGVAPAVRTMLDTHRLTVVGVLLTHGHPDHTWDCAEVAEDAPVYVGAADASRLDDPAVHLGPSMAGMFVDLAWTPWRTPGTVVPVADGESVDLLPDLPLTATAAPGHTPGSMVWSPPTGLEVSGPAFDEARLTGTAGALSLTGDVIFAGSIGRTDLPGGDGRQMQVTLQQLTATIPAAAVLVPGHGPASTMSRELAVNPYLQQVTRG